MIEVLRNPLNLLPHGQIDGTFILGTSAVGTAAAAGLLLQPWLLRLAKSQQKSRAGLAMFDATAQRQASMVRGG